MQRLSEKGLTHSLKKVPHSGKKRKANGETKVESAASEEQAEQPAPLAEDSASAAPLPNSPHSPHSGVSAPRTSSIIKDAATANLTAKVLEEEEARKRRRKMMGENETLKSLFSKPNGPPHKQQHADFMTRGFSIPANARR